MRLAYVLLSPTFGMHQYSADLANRMLRAGHDVHVVTTCHLPRDRYAPGVNIHTPVSFSTTGPSGLGLGLQAVRAALRVIERQDVDLVHFTGPHFWNVQMVRSLAARGLPVIHTIHDLDPHRGSSQRMLIRLWNRLIIHSAHHILVHGQIYRRRLISMGVPPQRVTWTPLLHLFLGSDYAARECDLLSPVEYQPWALFFGRMEQYKGVDQLLTACAMMNGVNAPGPHMVLAGAGDLKALWADPTPPRLELRNYQIDDLEALGLFQRCGLVVLPYVDATQSALIGAAYYFHKPVVVTHCGALPEYVVDGCTGRVLEAGHPATLARCLEEMLSGPAALARMGAAGREWYDHYRGVEHQALLDMYDRVARTGRKDRGNR